MRSTLIAFLTFASALTAVSDARAQQGVYDPFEKANRRAYAFNAAIDRILIRPLSRVAAGLTPGPIGQAIHNVLQNLNEPVVIVNDLLQARPVQAGRSITRLVVNTTVGLLGTADVAKGLGLPHHPNGFGDTLGRYGAQPGPYLYLPVAGPYNLRDLIGTGLDAVASPLWWIHFRYKSDILIALNVAGGLNERAQAESELDALLSSADDPYATLRAAYMQAREGEIRGETKSPVLPDIGPANPIPAAPAVEPGETPNAGPPSLLDSPPPPDTAPSPSQPPPSQPAPPSSP